ncbi:hypothetical protein Q1695_014089 [Nippostrongylus brasiliensis]|nr:hypothetical protein Q1695_014089 [Nippostrongylus brasiliensis]
MEETLEGSDFKTSTTQEQLVFPLGSNLPGPVKESFPPPPESIASSSNVEVQQTRLDVLPKDVIRNSSVAAGNSQSAIFALGTI